MEIRVGCKVVFARRGELRFGTVTEIIDAARVLVGLWVVEISEIVRIHA